MVSAIAVTENQKRIDIGTKIKITTVAEIAHSVTSDVGIDIVNIHAPRADSITSVRAVAETKEAGGTELLMRSRHGLETTKPNAVDNVMSNIAVSIEGEDREAILAQTNALKKINDRLTDHSYLDASDIEVDVQNGEVSLTGFVNSRNDKRMAEDIVEDVSGVKNVENRLRVQQNNYAGRNLGYDKVTGHGELNRQEVNATQQTSETFGQARGKTTSS